MFDSLHLFTSKLCGWHMRIVFTCYAHKRILQMVSDIQEPEFATTKLIYKLIKSHICKSALLQDFTDKKGGGSNKFSPHSFPKTVRAINEKAF